ncbi:MAG: hypothetical protein HC767_04385, partial [Akkermansiaceae bacterium]|nr:hypothetical protein [Akkermansiaceae bacterium]
MKQVLQNLKDGSTEVADVPAPRAGRGQLLIRSTHTLVSAGTERMLVEFGKAGLIDKARQQPDKVRMVLKIAKEPISLETPVGEEEDSHLGDFIEDKAAICPQEAILNHSLAENTRKVLATL